MLDTKTGLETWASVVLIQVINVYGRLIAYLVVKGMEYQNPKLKMPGGHRDEKDANPIMTAIREVLEESGVRIFERDFVSLVPLITNAVHRRVVLSEKKYIYVVTVSEERVLAEMYNPLLNPTREKPDGNEQEVAHILTPEDMSWEIPKRNFVDQQIADFQKTGLVHYIARGTLITKEIFQTLAT